MGNCHDWYTPDRESVYCRRCDVRAGSLMAAEPCGIDCHTPALMSATPLHKHTTTPEGQPCKK